MAGRPSLARFVRGSGWLDSSADLFKVRLFFHEGSRDKKDKNHSNDYVIHIKRRLVRKTSVDSNHPSI